LTRLQEIFLDENRELVSLSHGQLWTPDAAQSSTPVNTQEVAGNGRFQKEGLGKAQIGGNF
jgi:hypothetical protein